MHAKDTEPEMPGMPEHPRGDAYQRRLFILGPAPLTVIATLAVIVGLYVSKPFVIGAVSGLELALRWSFVACLPYIAICLVILTQRLMEGAHDPLAGAESTRLRIHQRAMQNTMEQLVWFALCLIPLSTVLKPEEVHLIPILAGMFVFGRLIYWRGYFVDGTLGRRYGVQVTFTVNIGIALLTAGLFILRG